MNYLKLRTIMQVHYNSTVIMRDRLIGEITRLYKQMIKKSGIIDNYRVINNYRITDNGIINKPDDT